MHFQFDHWQAMPRRDWIYAVTDVMQLAHAPIQPMHVFSNGGMSRWRCLRPRPASQIELL
jgi:hypothetical protein